VLDLRKTVRAPNNEHQELRDVLYIDYFEKRSAVTRGGDHVVLFLLF
jgi:hypothetical protein